jgi:hypothetical protein
MPKSRRPKRPKTRTVPMTPRVRDALEAQLILFRRKFGRDPGPNDPVFFDPDKDVPTPIDPEPDVVAALEKAGVNPAIIFAYRKTGLLITGDNFEGYAPEDLAEWDAAMQEYLNANKPGSDEPADPHLWSSELPEFQASPLTRADHDQVMACLSAFTPIQAQGMTTRARTELAAALSADAAASAYRSAES